jgi:O-antigen/teichoic acid export membrane protein
VFSIPDTFQLVKRTAPYALVLLLMTIYTRLDGLMLERLLNDEGYSAGVYATGFRLLDAANMIGILFAMLMLPMFSKIIGEKEKLMVLVEEVTKLLFVITLLVCLISWFYSEEIINLIYTNNTDMHYKVYKYLMLGFFAMGMSNIFGCLFLAKEKLKQINWLFFFGILLNIALNFYFIPKYLAFGAVIATLITQFFVFIGQIWLATQEFSLKYSAKAMIGFVVILVVGYLLFYIGREYIGLQWIIELILISFLVIVLSFLCGFLRSPLGFSK